MPCYKGENAKLIAAGGSGSNEAKVFDHSHGNKVFIWIFYNNYNLMPS